MSSSDIKVTEKHYSDAINETEKWTRLPLMNTPRAVFGATAIGEKIYIAGGWNSNYEYLEYFSDVEVYDRKSNKWSRLSNMKKKRGFCAVTSVGGKVYALGGENNEILASCEMFDPATNRWTDIPSMEKPRSGCAACAIGDMLYVIGGGASKDNDEYLSSVEMFDTVTKTWSLIPDMTTKRVGCAAVSVRSNIYVFGGTSCHTCNEAVSSCEVYDITTQEWTQLPEMQEKRLFCAATVVGNKIYVVGGRDGSNDLSSCEVFDISTNTWSSIPNMLEIRSGCQAVSICSKIVVMGGQNDYTVHSSVEAFDTITDRSIPPREEGILEIISKMPVMLYMCMVLLTQMKKDEIDTILNSNTEDGQPATQTNVLTRHVTSTNDSTRSSSMTVHQRVLFIEENIGQTHDPSAILIKRIEFLEIHVLGEIQNTGKSLTKRIEDLEASFFGH